MHRKASPSTHKSHKHLQLYKPISFPQATDANLKISVCILVPKDPWCNQIQFFFYEFLKIKKRFYKICSSIDVRNVSIDA